MTNSDRPTPIELERLDGGGLRIRWSDGGVRDYTPRELRDACPCATCREKRSAPPPPATQLTVLSPEEARPLRIDGMRPTGSYAYAIQFSDGHNTGLFTLDLLRTLGSEAPQ